MSEPQFSTTRLRLAGSAPDFAPPGFGIVVFPGEELEGSSPSLPTSRHVCDHVIPGGTSVSCGDHCVSAPGGRRGAMPCGCLLRRFLRRWCTGIGAALSALPQRDVHRVVEVMLPRHEGVSRSDFRTVAEPLGDHVGRVLLHHVTLETGSGSKNCWGTARSSIPAAPITPTGCSSPSPPGRRWWPSWPRRPTTTTASRRSPATRGRQGPPTSTPCMIAGQSRIDCASRNSITQVAAPLHRHLTIICSSRHYSQHLD